VWSTCYYCELINKLELCGQISEKYSNIEFNENPSSGSRVVPYRRRKVTKLIIAFRNLVNRPYKNCGTHRTSMYTDVPSRTFLTTKTPPSFVNHSTLRRTLWFSFSRKVDQVNQYSVARPQFHKWFLLDHFPYLRFIYAWFSYILPVIVATPISPFHTRLLLKSVLFAQGYCSNLFFSHRVTAQICSFHTRLLLKSVLFTPGYCSNLFFSHQFTAQICFFAPG